MNIIFDHIEIIDWYDGLIRGIAKSRNESYLVVLLEWKYNSNEVLFGFIELYSDNVEAIENCFDDSTSSKERQWDCFESKYEQIVGTYADKLFLLSEYPKVGLENNLTQSDYSEYKPKFLDWEIEKIMTFQTENS